MVLSRFSKETSGGGEVFYCASTFKSPKSLIDGALVVSGGVFTQEQEASGEMLQIVHIYLKNCESTSQSLDELACYILPTQFITPFDISKAGPFMVCFGVRHPFPAEQQLRNIAMVLQLFVPQPLMFGTKSW
ncbi:hypothetical protein L1987_54289 [Smallanthus sonchifolius]|uniref:Uncharacterized protein n=1 Tax=Smallanthus sonchifolius TaxID=185202 RepID=A0ACB9E768_9ASTR|nr:hypothetical protein L1987_54289 [Smallanthus sonchifolius]